jgi:hypothetical protein
MFEHGMGIAMMDKLRRASFNKPKPVYGHHPQQRR